MNDATANLPALKMVESKPPDENQPVEPNRVTTAEGWTPARWLTVIALVLATHVALIFLFGEKKEIVPRAATNVPTLTLANNSDELLALNDPTLFALPQQRDFASASWLKISPVKPPKFSWTEPAQPLQSPSANSLGMAFGQFMRTNLFAIQPLDFKLAAELSTPTLPVETVPAQNSTMQIEGELAKRQLPSGTILTNWPYADVLVPCVVQVLVNPEGNKVSPVLLTSSGYDVADQRALELARTLRFAPSPGATFGRIIFNWHTVPPETTTNGNE